MHSFCEKTPESSRIFGRVHIEGPGGHQDTYLLCKLDLKITGDVLFEKKNQLVNILYFFKSQNRIYTI